METTATANHVVQTVAGIDIHVQKIKEENIDIKQLPKEIQNEIRMWDMQWKKVQNTKSENHMISLRKKAIVIADMIQDWIEKDYPDTLTDDGNNKNDPPKPKTKEEQVLEVINDSEEGVIIYNDLCKILGVKSVGLRLQIGKTKLKNIWLTDKYKIA